MDYSLLVGINDCKLSAEDGDDSDSESIEGLDKNGYNSSDDGLGNKLNTVTSILSACTKEHVTYICIVYRKDRC